MSTSLEVFPTIWMTSAEDLGFSEKKFLLPFLIFRSNRFSGIPPINGSVVADVNAVHHRFLIVFCDGARRRKKCVFCKIKLRQGTKMTQRPKLKAPRSNFLGTIDAVRGRWLESSLMNYLMKNLTDYVQLVSVICRSQTFHVKSKPSLLRERNSSKWAGFF